MSNGFGSSNSTNGKNGTSTQKKHNPQDGKSNQNSNSGYSTPRPQINDSVLSKLFLWTRRIFIVGAACYVIGIFVEWERDGGNSGGTSSGVSSHSSTNSGARNLRNSASSPQPPAAKTSLAPYTDGAVWSAHWTAKPAHGPSAASTASTASTLPDSSSAPPHVSPTVLLTPPTPPSAIGSHPASSSFFSRLWQLTPEEKAQALEHHEKEERYQRNLRRAAERAEQADRIEAVQIAVMTLTAVGWASWKVWQGLKWLRGGE